MWSSSCTRTMVRLCQPLAMDLQALPGRPGMLASLSRPAAAMRLFSASKHAEARKQEIKEVRPGADVEALSGKPDEDGMNIYQMDFVETALWTKELLLKMKHHEQLLKGLREDTAPKDTDAILTFKTTSVYDYDFTKPSPDPRNKSVECSFRVSDLVAMRQWNAKQRHKLLLLCGDRYDPAADTVTLTCDRYDERIFNKIHLSDAVDRLIGEVQKKNSTDFFEDVPLDLRYVEEKAKDAAVAKRRKPRPQVWQTPAFWAANARKRKEGLQKV